MSVLDWASDELAAWESAGLLRRPRVIDTASAPEVVIDGRRVVLLCSNNYLGLADDPRVRSAAALAARRWGAGAGASRLVSGTSALHRELEVELARFKGAEDVVLFSSGYLANLGVLTTLTGADDVVFSDELNHASIVDGCRLSKASVAVYPHADVDALEEMLGSTTARRRVVVTDSVFSMDGDLAPLRALCEVCVRHGAILVVDEAHATGVLGSSGSGAVEELGVAGRVPVVVGTLSKALGSAGGYVTTTAELGSLMRNRARTHVFDTAPAPATVAAALAALRIVQGEPWRRARARSLAARLADGLRDIGLDVATPAAAVVPVFVGDARDACELSDRLLEHGVFCPAIRPPSVPEGTSRLRATVMATHTDEHIERALDAFVRALGKLNAVRRRLASPKPRRRGYFVTGTDTGVGKTIATASLARCLSRAGHRVAIFKPIQTGTIDGADDAAFASRLAGCDGYVGVALPDPLAPSVAARRVDEAIDVGAITDRFRQLQSDYDVVVVEGAGGLLVPIDDETTMADLAQAFGLPVIVVARPALGTLNHTALTIEAARMRGLDVFGIVISAMPASPGIAERTNPAQLEKLCDAPLVGVIPTLDGFGVERGATPSHFEPTPWLSADLGGSFDRATFLAELRDEVAEISS